MVDLRYVHYVRKLYGYSLTVKNGFVNLGLKSVKLLQISVVN